MDSEDSNDKDSIWKHIAKYIPLFYALLIYIGYLNKNFYFIEFDLSIEDYLTLGELIFSFLPLTIPFTILLLILYSSFSGAFILYKGGNKGSEKRSFTTPKVAFESLKNL